MIVLECAPSRGPGRPFGGSGRALALVCALAALLAWVGPLGATETRSWRVDTAEELLEGRGDGVAVSDDGRLLRAPRWQSEARLEEPVVMAGASLRDGSLVIGTGHPARLYRLKGGELELLTDVPAEQITALLARDSGQVLVATVSPAGLFSWEKGELEELASLEDGTIWDILELGGQVVVGTGTPAALHRLGRRGLERWLELPDAHVRCLAPAEDGILVGTSGKGLILKVDDAGRVAMLADSPFTEISDLVVAADETVWAVALVGEPVKPKDATEGSSAEQSSSEVSAASLDLPKVNGSTASSEVLHLTPEGALVGVHRFTKQVASALAADGDAVLVGTGFEGEVWSFVPTGGSRLAVVDGVQVTAILGGGDAVLTQGPGAVMRRRDVGRAASFRIDAERFPRPVRFGRFEIEPSPTEARIRFRSGAAEKPDDTWLPWTDWVDGGSGEVPLPAATSLQWEVELPQGRKLSEDGIEGVEVFYREVNLAPRISEVEVEEPGAVYLGSPPPSGPVVDVANPDFNGIFTVLDEKGNGPSQPKQGRKFWRVGFRTVSWKAEDPNGDPVRCTVELERVDGFRLPVRERLETTQLSIDTTAVADGRYRFRIAASDEERNPGAGLEDEASSHWFVVDSTPPRLHLERQDGRWTVRAVDAGSPLVRVEWSRDGERWNGLAAEDGLLDGSAESFSFPAAQTGRHLVVVRALDSHHNRTTVSAVEE